jgi:putative transcriptional regulator
MQTIIETPAYLSDAEALGLTDAERTAIVDAEESDTMSKAGSRILTSARQALAYATGEADASQHGVHIPEHLDVRSIRQKIKMSQEEFARHFGVNKRTVQDWEQGRRIRRDQHEHSLW